MMIEQLFFYSFLLKKLPPQKKWTKWNRIRNETHNNSMSLDNWLFQTTSFLEWILSLFFSDLRFGTIIFESFFFDSILVCNDNFHSIPQAMKWLRLEVIEKNFFNSKLSNISFSLGIFRLEGEFANQTNKLQS